MFLENRIYCSRVFRKLHIEVREDSGLAGGGLSRWAEVRGSPLTRGEEGAKREDDSLQADGGSEGKWTAGIQRVQERQQGMGKRKEGEGGGE